MENTMILIEGSNDAVQKGVKMENCRMEVIRKVKKLNMNILKRRIRKPNKER